MPTDHHQDVRCASCGYLLRGSQQSGLCPECGYSIPLSLQTPSEAPRHTAARLFTSLAGSVTGALLGSIGAFFGLGLPASDFFVALGYGLFTGLVPAIPLAFVFAFIRGLPPFLSGFGALLVSGLTSAYFLYYLAGGASC